MSAAGFSFCLLLLYLSYLRPVSNCKQAKANAKRVWELEGCDDLVDTIVADIKKRKDNPEWTGRYVPLPQNYLRGRRWEDECSAPTRDQPNWI